MATMKALRIHSFGGPEVMKLEDMPVPQPGDDEVLLRVHAASVEIRSITRPEPVNFPRSAATSCR